MGSPTTSPAGGSEAVPAENSTNSTNITLTPEFEAALNALHAGGNLFLTGKAGTGKSTLINLYLDQTTRRTVTVAPTGIAALNVGGYTIHRLFSFGPDITIDHVRSDRYRPGRFARALKRLDTLIIDEASMVRADVFDCLVAALERFGPRPGTPYGGVQLVLVGDLYQLPPVVMEQEEQWIEDTFGTPFFFSATSFDRSDFPTVELTTVFRQRNDDRLVEILNAVRSGELLRDARSELNRRTRPDFEPPTDEFWLTLTTTNARADNCNRRNLEALSGPVQEFRATVRGDTDGFDFPTEEELHLAVGAQVMLLNNDPADRWVNGTLGKITAITVDRGEPLVTVLCRDGSTVDVGKHTWEITRPTVENGALSYEVLGSFTQIPVRLAWAVTIHKSQGQTLDRVIVDLTGGTFAAGQLYVALSRCTSVDGLVLVRDVQPQNLRADMRVRRYLAEETGETTGIGDVYLAMLTVGDSGRNWRPRPVEIAVVTDEGDEATTVVNPTRDLGDAKQRYGITTRDVQLAPLLTEAWPALASFLEGRVPVGVNADRQLGFLDFELKRNGVVVQMPVPREIPIDMLTASEQEELDAPTALQRARAVRAAVRRAREQGTDIPAAGTAFTGATEQQGYTLVRTSGGSGTFSPDDFAVGGDISGGDDDALVLAGMLATAWERVTSPDAQVVERVRAVERSLGVQILPGDLQLSAAVSMDEVFLPGARVCFTGSVVSPTSGPVSKEELHAMAEKCRLIPVDSCTKSKTDVLVVAEAGSQSSKAKNAKKWGKPMVVAEEFLEWSGSH